jgi:hypothetical protein
MKKYSKFIKNLAIISVFLWFPSLRIYTQYTSTENEKPTEMTKEEKDEKKIIIRDAMIRTYQLDFNFGNQMTNDFPIFHWGLGFNSTSFKELYYQINYDNYYGNDPASFLFSDDFLSLGLEVKYNFPYFYTGGGIILFTLPNKFDSQIDDNIGLHPELLLGLLFKDFFYTFSFDLQTSVIAFSDGIWLDIRPLLDWKISNLMSFYFAFLFRMSYAENVEHHTGLKKAFAKIPQFGVRFYW